MKIEDFRNPTLVVDFWLMMTSKIICGWIQWPDIHILFTFQVNRMKIDNFINVTHVDVLANVDLLTSKLRGGWIQRPNIQMLFKFQVNRINIEDFRNPDCVDLLVYFDLLADSDPKNNKWLNSVTWYVKPFQISN